MHGPFSDLSGEHLKSRVDVLYYLRVGTRQAGVLTGTKQLEMEVHLHC